MADKFPQEKLNELSLKLAHKKNVLDFAFDLCQAQDTSKLFARVAIKPSDLKGFVTTCEIDDGTGQCNPTDMLIPDPNGRLLAMILLNAENGKTKS